MGKAIGVGIVAAGGALFVRTLPELKRYMKIKSM
jgi:hypothetical protein